LFANVIMLKLLLGFVVSLACFAQDCRFPLTLSAVGTAPQNSVGFNNQATGCQYWTVVFFNTGFSAVSVRFESAPVGNSSSVPGTFVAFAGTTIGAGVNPSTSITQDSNSFKGLYPFVQVNLQSVTGTGLITGFVYGYKNQPANYGTIAGGLFPFTLTPPPACAALTQFNFSPAGDVTTCVNNPQYLTLEQNGGDGNGCISAVIKSEIGSSYTFTVGFNVGGNLHVAGSTEAYIFLTDGTKGIVYGVRWTGGNSPEGIAAKFSTASSNSNPGFSAYYIDLTGMAFMQPVEWFQIVEDGVHRTYNVSSDGINFIQVQQTVVGDFLTTASYGVAVRNTTNSGQIGQMTVYSWKETSP
jgi:hypothetical protein